MADITNACSTTTNVMSWPRETSLSIMQKCCLQENVSNAPSTTSHGANLQHLRNAHKYFVPKLRPCETTGPRPLHISPLATYHSHLAHRMPRTAETRSVSIPTIPVRNVLVSQPPRIHSLFPCSAHCDRVIETSQQKKDEKQRQSKTFLNITPRATTPNLRPTTASNDM